MLSENSYAKKIRKVRSSEALSPLLDYFAGRESGAYRVDFYLHFVARLSLGDEDYEAFDPCDSVTATAGLFDVKLVLLALLNWFVEGLFITHAFHLIRLNQLVPREK